jgi:REP element-mobilizing transposase RayT
MSARPNPHRVRANSRTRSTDSLASAYRGWVARHGRDQTPGFHHVYSRGTGGAPFFVDDDDRRLFIQLLERTAALLEWRIQVYCLMTTHYHVVVETKNANLSAGLQRLNSKYVLAFNTRWGRFGTLVAGRFGSRVIEDDEYLAEVCRYVALNPVKAQLCERARDWPWTGGLAASNLTDL